MLERSAALRRPAAPAEEDAGEEAPATPLPPTFRLLDQALLDLYLPNVSYTRTTVFFKSECSHSCFHPSHPTVSGCHQPLHFSCCVSLDACAQALLTSCQLLMIGARHHVCCQSCCEVTVLPVTFAASVLTVTALCLSPFLFAKILLCLT